MSTKVVMTAEPRPDGYASHLLTVERGNADSVQILQLTDLELAELTCLLENYQAVLSTVSMKFTDHTGRLADAS